MKFLAKHIFLCIIFYIPLTAYSFQAQDIYLEICNVSSVVIEAKVPWDVRYFDQGDCFTYKNVKYPGKVIITLTQIDGIPIAEGEICRASIVTVLPPDDSSNQLNVKIKCLEASKDGIRTQMRLSK